MKKFNKSFIVYTISLGAFLLFLVLLFVPGKNELLWKNYYLLLVNEKNPVLKVLEDLDEIFVPEKMISLETSTVNITTFSGMERVKLRDIGGRLDSEDPRLDPYIKDLGKWFQSEPGWQSVYLESKIPGVLFYLKLRDLCRKKGYTVRLPEFDPVEKILSLVTTWLFLIFLIFSIKKNPFKGLMIFCTLSWSVYLLSGSLYDVLSYCVLTPFFFLLVKEIAALLDEIVIYNWKRINLDRLILRGVKYLLALLLTAVLNDNILNSSFPLIPVAGNWLAAIGYLTFYFYLKQKKPHRIFRYINWVKVPRPEFTKLNMRNVSFILLFLLAIAFIPIYYFLKSGGNGVDIPMPEVVSMSREPDMALLKRMSERHERGLPDFSDYIIHTAYQESLVFGGTYKFPTPGSITIPDFSSRGGKIELSLAAPLSFDNSWLRKTISITAGDMEKNSIERMILDQKTQITVDLKPINILYRIKYLYWKDLSLFIFFIIPLFFLYFYLTPPVLYGIRNLLLRRKHRTT